ncbi:MAG: HD domain-containing protein [Clostridiales bacterium]|nr:HD domain-containing protein [Clostridiales bacterium]
MNFKTLPNGMCDGFVILKKCDVKNSKNGSAYLDLILGDKEGEIPAKLWDYKEDGLYETEMIVKVRGTIEQYNGKDQFRIAQIRPVSSADDYNIADLVPASEVGGEQIFNMLLKRVNAFKDNDLKSIVLSILESKKELLVSCPAAFRLHHAMVGGLMLHTMSIVRMAEEICKIYPNIDKELLLSGAILHDTAKTWEFELSKTGLVKGYSTEGELIGHLVKGAMYVEETAKQLGIKSEKVVLLQHMILSHHGVPEFGSPIRPMFLEAEILSSLDSLDATIFEINNATGKVKAGEFTDRQWALDNRKLYNHGLTNNEHKVNLGE